MISTWILGGNDAFTVELTEKIRKADNISIEKTSGNEDEILQWLINSSADIIFIDTQLTGKRNCLHLLKEIQEYRKNIKVIILLAEEDEKFVYSAVCSGAYDYFVKGTPLTNIKEKIEEVFNSDTPLGSVLKNKIKKSFESVSKVQNEYNLSDREKEILTLIVGGLTKQKIADMLALSFHTIDSHLRNIYRKLGVQSKSQAITKVLNGNMLISE